MCQYTDAQLKKNHQVAADGKLPGINYKTYYLHLSNNWYKLVCLVVSIYPWFNVS